MDKRRDRESNIELLRILAMLGVIILHYVIWLTLHTA